MKIYKDTNYGADADGNRGITVYEAEIDDYDYDNIRDIIRDAYEEDTTNYNITLKEDGMEFEFTVNIYDYFTDDEIEAIKKEIE